MVIYVCKTKNGIWVKADPQNEGSVKALKIWWATKGHSMNDYLDRSLTNDRRQPVYAITSLGEPKEAVPKFKIAMAEMAVKITILEPPEFHAKIMHEID